MTALHRPQARYCERGLNLSLSSLYEEDMSQSLGGNTPLSLRHFPTDDRAAGHTSARAVISRPMHVRLPHQTTCRHRR